MSEPDRVPRKVRQALTELGIRGVVDGYVTYLKGGAAFTCWDSAGEVVCVLVSSKGAGVWQVSTGT